MTVVAIIPARGGSRRLPLKNLLPFGNTTLLGQCIATAKEVADRVVVATDNRRIGREATLCGADVFIRDEVPEDQTSDEVFLEVINGLGLEDADTCILMQCTSPNISANTLSEALRHFQFRPVAACCYSARPYTHEYFGAFVITIPAEVRATGSRFGDNPHLAHVVPEEEISDIDTYEDYALACELEGYDPLPDNQADSDGKTDVDAMIAAYEGKEIPGR